MSRANKKDVESERARKRAREREVGKKSKQGRELEEERPGLAV